jgi:hypothetical protein
VKPLLNQIAEAEQSLAESRDRMNELEGIIAQLDQGSPDIQPHEKTGNITKRSGLTIWLATLGRGARFIVVA